MPLTSYLDIIPLERAKTYLRIDDPTQPHPDDLEIVSMIKGAFRFIERYTNHIMYAREFTQRGGKIYNYPLNTVEGSADDMEWFNHYYQRNHDYISLPSNQDVTVTYNAGYKELEDIPDDLIQAALQMLKVWYFESEKQQNSTLIPISVTMVLDTYRRFV